MKGVLICISLSPPIACSPLLGLVAQSCLTLCDPVDCSLPGFSVHGILQARILEWVAIPFSRGSSNPGIEPRSPAVAGRFFTTEPPGKPRKSTIPQSLCNSMDSSPPGSSVHGILQARMLEWVAIAFSRGSSNPGIELRSPSLQADSLPSEPPGKPSDQPTKKKKKKLSNSQVEISFDC